jgi:hypothetical protein
MVITKYVMPPFTYPNVSLYSHRVIIVLCDLQIFMCPMNDGATHVPLHHVAGYKDLRRIDALHHDPSPSWGLQCRGGFDTTFPLRQGPFTRSGLASAPSRPRLRHAIACHL